MHAAQRCRAPLPRLPSRGPQQQQRDLSPVDKGRSPLHGISQGGQSVREPVDLLESTRLLLESVSLHRLHRVTGPDRPSPPSLRPRQWSRPERALNRSALQCLLLSVHWGTSRLVRNVLGGSMITGQSSFSQRRFVCRHCYQAMEHYLKRKQLLDRLHPRLHRPPCGDPTRNCRGLGPKACSRKDWL